MLPVRRRYRCRVHAMDGIANDANCTEPLQKTGAGLKCLLRQSITISCTTRFMVKVNRQSVWEAGELIVIKVGEV